MRPENLIQVLQSHFRSQPNSSCLRFFRDGRWRDLSYAQVEERVRSICSGLVALGVQPGDRVAIMSQNRPEWALCDLGAIFTGCVVVSLYSDLKPDEAAYILEHSESRVVFVEDRTQAEKILSVRGRLPELKAIVLIEGGEPEGISLAEVEGRCDGGRAMERIAESARAARTAPLTIVYTSGTTGAPKGAVLTHGNILAVAEMGLEAISKGQELPRLNLSFLPLAHALERVGGHFMPLYIGGTIAYARSLDTIAEDVAAIRPDFSIAVPRFFEKLHNRVQSQIREASPLRRAIFAWAVGVGSERSKCLEAGKAVRPWVACKFALADRLVFAKIRAKLGGRMRYFVSGGAPLSSELARFFHSAGILICEGYGATETSAPATLNTPTTYRFGSVGKALPGVEMRIAEDGEVLVRGPNLFQGYYKDPDATRAAFDADGFYRTGDIGRVDEDGFYYITDRKKELIITASGKNIAPQKLENMLRARPYISNALVHCDRRPYVVALITLDHVAIQAARPVLDDAAAQSEILRAMIEKQIEVVNQELPRFEQIKDFRILDEDFSAQSGEMTLTFKLKRRVIEARHRALLDQMYSRHESRPGAL
ncbi:MAG: long-chain fatty acid--CoA ligase [Acidobacteria bacterium]|nr:long-chain fatty acid--CoA ligase [Acidobacteriota bacterium]